MAELSGPLRSDLTVRPIRFFLLLVVASAVAYVPLSVAYGSFFWLQVGPAELQINRLLLYATYFLAGLFLGAHGVERTFLATDSALAQRWVVWTGAALVAFMVNLVLSVGGANEVLTGLAFTLSSATISFAFLALFLRFAQSRRGSFDSLFRNSYGIYVIHYGIVSGLLLALLGAQLPAMAKWAIVFPSALALSWGATAALRRIPGVARVV